MLFITRSKSKIQDGVHGQTNVFTLTSANGFITIFVSIGTAITTTDEIMDTCTVMQGPHQDQKLKVPIVDDWHVCMVLFTHLD